MRYAYHAMIRKAHHGKDIWNLNNTNKTISEEEMINYITREYILKCTNKPLYIGEKLTVDYYRLRNFMRNNKSRVPLSYLYVKKIKHKQVMSLEMFFKKVIEFGQVLRRKKEKEEFERKIKGGEITPVIPREEWRLSDLEDD